MDVKKMNMTLNGYFNNNSRVTSLLSPKMKGILAGYLAKFFFLIHPRDADNRSSSVKSGVIHYNKDLITLL